MDLISLFLFILPAYFANAVPVLFGGGRPIDGGKYFFDGRRVLGDGKTIRGFMSGVLIGTPVGFMLSNLIGGFLLSFGALVGDSVGSFLKRRIGIGRGDIFPLVDQLMFLFFALLFVSPIQKITFFDVLLLSFVTIPIHVGMNYVAFRFRLKYVPW